MKKVLTLTLAVMLAMAMFTTRTFSQDAFFATKKGLVLTYKAADAQGNTTGYSVITIKDVQGSGQDMSITYRVESLDKARRPLDSFGAQTFTVKLKDNVAYFDLNQFVPAQMKQPGMKMEVSGITMELPNDLKPGQKIKDSKITMTMDLGVMKMNAEVKMVEGECLAVEDVTVPAGTFKSHKITQTVVASVSGMETTTRILSWYAPGLGTVKTEAYDNAYNLLSSNVLAEKRD